MHKTRALPCFALTLAGLTSAAVAQDLPARWDELTAADWPRAMERSAATCILPIGILEKHGPHAPMGSDLIHVREWSARAAKREYAVVFPDYFYGQIYEARHQPGTFALPSRLVLELLQATTDEIGRNGFKKIVIVNGHGGNPNLLRYFVQSQLAERHDYVVYFFDPAPDPAIDEQVKKLRKSDPTGDSHAGERETSTLLYLRPDLVQMGKATQESGANQKRLSLPDLYTAIWW
jgi:creatinine amidohydrolase